MTPSPVVWLSLALNSRTFLLLLPTDHVLGQGAAFSLALVLFLGGFEQAALRTGKGKRPVQLDSRCPQREAGLAAD